MQTDFWAFLHSTEAAVVWWQGRKCAKEKLVIKSADAAARLLLLILCKPSCNWGRKNLEQNLSQFEKNRIKCIWWYTVLPYPLHVEVETLKLKHWTHLHWYIILFSQLLHTWRMRREWVSLMTMLITVASEDEKRSPPMMTSRIGRALPLWYCGFQPSHLDRSADQQSVIHRWE